jgi:glycosyltransferase involved in cell wall biosynthesis
LIKGWSKEIDLSKITHISNGVDISTFDKNANEYQLKDADLNSEAYKNIIYAGSIRKVNNIGMLLDTAKIIQDQGFDDIRFLIFGSGNEMEFLKKRCREENITNVVFKGSVDKKYIPYILKKAYINILHNSSTSLDKYGQSQNKLFEYLAAGRCIVQTYSPNYNICEEGNCGISIPIQNPEEIAKAITTACTDEARCKKMGKNGRILACEFDFSELTEKLVRVIENV